METEPIRERVNRVTTQWLAKCASEDEGDLALELYGDNLRLYLDELDTMIVAFVRAELAALEKSISDQRSVIGAISSMITPPREHTPGRLVDEILNITAAYIGTGRTPTGDREGAKTTRHLAASEAERAEKILSSIQCVELVGSKIRLDRLPSGWMQSVWESRSTLQGGGWRAVGKLDDAEALRLMGGVTESQEAYEQQNARYPASEPW